KVAIVDDEDFERLSRYKWFYHDQGYAARSAWVNGKRRTIYMHREIMQPPKGAQIDHVNGKRRGVFMHRQIMQPPKDLEVDHINGDKLDNRRSNLRIVTRQQNRFNERPRKGTSSKYKGVSWYKQTRRWEAYIKINGKKKRIGYFNDEIEAALAYDRAARELFGEYAKTNFKEDDFRG